MSFRHAVVIEVFSLTENYSWVKSSRTSRYWTETSIRKPLQGARSTSYENAWTQYARVANQYSSVAADLPIDIATLIKFHQPGRGFEHWKTSYSPKPSYAGYEDSENWNIRVFGLRPQNPNQYLNPGFRWYHVSQKIDNTKHKLFRNGEVVVPFYGPWDSAFGSSYLLVLSHKAFRISCLYFDMFTNLLFQFATIVHRESLADQIINTFVTQNRSFGWLLAYTHSKGANDPFSLLEVQVLCLVTSQQWGITTADRSLRLNI